MGLLGPKGALKVGLKTTHLRGYINRRGRLKTLTLATIHAHEQYPIQSLPHGHDIVAMRIMN